MERSSKTPARTSDAVGYGDCRHDCDGEESHQLSKGDHVHDDHDDRSSASGSRGGLVMFPLFHCTSELYSARSWVFTVLLPSP